MITLDVHTTQRQQMVDITADVARAVSPHTDGFVVVYCPHTTAAVTIQENDDPDVKTDLLAHLGKLIPQDPSFRHAEGNADAHIKSSLVGASATVLLEKGKLVLGRWQAIFFCEFDGPRARHVYVKVVGT